MNHAKCTFITICLLLTQFLQTNALSQPAAKLSIPRVFAGVDQTISVPIIVSTDSLIGLAQIVIEYDSTKIQLATPRVTIGTQLQSFTISAINDHLPFAPKSAGTNQNLLIQISGGGGNSFQGEKLDLARLHFHTTASLHDSTPVNLDPDFRHTFLVTQNLTTLNKSSMDFENGAVIIKDVVAPNPFDLLSPADSTWTNAALPTLRWGATADSGSGLKKYQLIIDQSVSVDSIPPAVTSAQPGDSLSDGDHTWYVQAIDNDDNIRPSRQSWHLLVDRTPPEARITRPAEGEELAQTRVVVEGTATDTHAGIRGIGVERVLISRDGGQTWAEASNTGEQFETWKYVWSNATPGDYTLKSRAVDKLGNSAESAQVVHIRILTPVEVASHRLPKRFAITQNYPNPFRPVAGAGTQPQGTRIEFQIPARQPVSIRIYDARGKLIRTIVNQTLPPGFYTRRWDGRDQMGLPVPSGVYFYRVVYGHRIQNRKLLLIR